MQTIGHVVYDIVHTCAKSSIVGFIPRILSEVLDEVVHTPEALGCGSARPLYGRVDPGALGLRSG